MKLLTLPFAFAPAAENMARDWLLLDDFPHPDEPRWRAYGWLKPAWTFGYSQNFAEVFARVGPGVELIRRATGGGLVDHRADWTYAVVLPPTHQLARAQARESYRAIHEALADALRAHAVPTALAPCAKDLCATESSTPARPVSATCFTRAEVFDVIRTDNSEKLAGAAQKRGPRGLLLQGSLSRATAREVSDWTQFAADFGQRLGTLLNAPPEAFTLPAFDPAALTSTTARFASPAWNEHREK